MIFEKVKTNKLHKYQINVFQDFLVNLEMCLKTKNKIESASTQSQLHFQNYDTLKIKQIY